MALPTDKPTTEGTDTRVEEEPEETTTQMAKADSPTSQGTSKKEEDDSEDTIPDIHPPKELEPWTTLSTTTELDGSLVTGNYPGEDDRIQRVQEAEQHRDYQKGKGKRGAVKKFALKLFIMTLLFLVLSTSFYISIVDRKSES